MSSKAKKKDPKAKPLKEDNVPESVNEEQEKAVILDASKSKSKSKPKGAKIQDPSTEKHDASEDDDLVDPEDLLEGRNPRTSPKKRRSPSLGW